MWALTRGGENPCAGAVGAPGNAAGWTGEVGGAEGNEAEASVGEEKAACVGGGAEGGELMSCRGGDRRGLAEVGDEGKEGEGANADNEPSGGVGSGWEGCRSK